jgi:putative oxidoreductase
MVSFFKDLSLAGAALMLLAFFAYAGHDLGLTLTGPLFDIS